ncbi:MAG TPA: hypothetical protein ENJ77_01125, partial [Candidatus Moranbacteria bacterium]|nr:hypothetical protein [Candidatus Moranbacteria bacterium]
MSEVLFSQIIFFLAVGWLFFFPGYLIVSATVGHALTPLEKIVLSPVFGLVFVNFAVLAAGASGVSIDRDLALFIPSLALLFPLSTRLFRSFDRQEKKEDFPSSLLLETRAAILAGLIIASALLTKTVFLGNTIFPTATDLGHHLFWVQKIISEEKLPVYQKQKISTNGEEISLGQPEPIADFIIGEHIPFALLARLTGGDLFGPEPVLFLSLLNIFSFLALYVLARRLFAHLPYARAAALLVLALGAALWAVSGPQSKFVSGGVIGNVMGNLFIPSVWL